MSSDMTRSQYCHQCPIIVHLLVISCYTSEDKLHNTRTKAPCGSTYLFMTPISTEMSVGAGGIGRHLACIYITVTTCLSG